MGLHQHDLLCYAGAMARALEGDGVAGDVVPALHKLELQVTARLRWASQTWVLFTVYELVCAGRFVGMGVLTGEGDRRSWLAMSVVMSTIIVVKLAPIASVAETFEYDVLQALNNPSMLKGAQ